MINLEKKYLDFVLLLLKEHIPDETVWLFGSRTTEKIKPYSDIDLVIVGDKPISSDILALLSLAFEESDLPYKVDILDWCMLDLDFKKIIQQRYEILQPGKKT
jgi:predicted nucleotidyltransferase